MKKLALYCKSYRTDLLRVMRLVDSVSRFNEEELPFFLSVPEEDFQLFREHIGANFVQLITDEEILKASPRVNLAQVRSMHGAISQQVVKSEFWRLKVSESYVCLDSDAMFIRPFFQHDFLAPDGFPYTVIDEAHDLLEAAMQHKMPRISEAFRNEAQKLQQIFGREGRSYSFGPFPLVWHAKVWESLEEQFLLPNSMSFAEAITKAPIESRWYGEALLAYNAIPLHPCQALFKVYHYAWQFDQEARKGVTNRELADIYCGVIYQSAWERDMDWPSEGGGLLSRTGRMLRRKMGRI